MSQKCFTYAVVNEQLNLPNDIISVSILLFKQVHNKIIFNPIKKYKQGYKEKESTVFSGQVKKTKFSVSSYYHIYGRGVILG